MDGAHPDDVVILGRMRRSCHIQGLGLVYRLNQTTIYKTDNASWTSSFFAFRNKLTIHERVESRVLDF